MGKKAYTDISWDKFKDLLSKLVGSITVLNNRIKNVEDQTLNYEYENYGKGLVMLRYGRLRIGMFTNNYTENPTWDMKEKDYPSYGTIYGGQFTSQGSTASVFPVANAESKTIYFGVRNGTWTSGWIFGEIVYLSNTAI